jgi:hypothetical protein
LTPDRVNNTRRLINLTAERVSLNYYSAIKWRTIRWTGHVARVGEWTGVYRVLVGNPEGNILLGSLRRKWENNIQKDPQEMVFWGSRTGWIWLRIGTAGGHL